DPVRTTGGAPDPRRRRGHPLRLPGGGGRGPPPTRRRDRECLRALRRHPVEGGEAVSIEVLNEVGYDLSEIELVGVSRYVLEEMRVHPQAELCIRLVDEETMTVLHEQWMDLPGPTDVMSFPMDELRPGPEGETSDEGVLGDIVLCPSVAEKQAAAAGH